LIRVKEEC